MKILIINHEFPPVGAGAASACETLAKYLVLSGHKIEVVTSRIGFSSSLEYRDKYAIRRVLGIRLSLYSGNILEVILFVINGFIYFLKKREWDKIDVVYVFFTLPAGMLGLFIKKLYKKPYYVFLRGIDVPGFYGGKFSSLNRILRPIIKYIWTNADKIVANSASLKDLAAKTLQNHAIHVMPNMIDTDLFCPSQTIKVDGVVKIISVGRLNKQKGLNILLESFAILVQGNTSIDFSLDIVGNGAEKSNLIKQSVMLNITKRINFRGWIKRINLVKSYQESDIFVSSSLDEGMPNSMLEAMACGLPIVASDIPAHREIIKSGENGLLISSQNPKELAGAIEILVKNKSLRQELGKNNVKKIKKYSLESKTVVL